MKKILFIVLFICSNIFAQDAEFFAKIRNLDEAGVDKIAIEIASFTRNEFRIVSRSETATSYIITMAKKSMTKDEVIEALNDNYADKDAIFDVVFERFMEGENTALELKGVKKYAFYGVTYNYLDLFPFWQKYFSPNATPESLLKDYSQQKSEIGEKRNWWLYKFQVADGKTRRLWTIRKFY